MYNIYTYEKQKKIWSKTLIIKKPKKNIKRKNKLNNQLFTNYENVSRNLFMMYINKNNVIFRWLQNQLQLRIIFLLLVQLGI